MNAACYVGTELKILQLERRRPLPSAEAETARPPPSVRPALTVGLRGDVLRRSERPDVALTAKEDGPRDMVSLSVAAHDAALAATREPATVTGRFDDGTADQVLLDESADLDLLVVGSRGYGTLGAVLMGSVSTALAHGAACPLLVTPRGTRFDLFD